MAPELRPTIACYNSFSMYERKTQIYLFIEIIDLPYEASWIVIRIMHTRDKPTALVICPELNVLKNNGSH